MPGKHSLRFPSAFCMALSCVCRETATPAAAGPAAGTGVLAGNPGERAGKGTGVGTRGVLVPSEHVTTTTDVGIRGKGIQYFLQNQIDSENVGTSHLTVESSGSEIDPFFDLQRLRTLSLKYNIDAVTADVCITARKGP